MEIPLHTQLKWQSPNPLTPACWQGWGDPGHPHLPVGMQNAAASGEEGTQPCPPTKPLVRWPHVQEPNPQFLQQIHSKRPETTQTSNHRATVSQLWGSTAR